MTIIRTLMHAELHRFHQAAIFNAIDFLLCLLCLLCPGLCTDTTAAADIIRTAPVT